MVEIRDNAVSSQEQVPEPETKKGTSKTLDTPQTRQISQAVKEPFHHILGFLQKLKASSEGNSHILGMRHALSDVKKAAIPLFKKLAETGKQAAGKLTDNRVVRKLKDLYEALEACELTFVRHSEDPLHVKNHDPALDDLLQQYADYEANHHGMSDEELINSVLTMLRTIAKLKFSKEKYPIRNAMVVEVLTKHLVTRSLAKNFTIPLPCFSPANEPVVVDYTLEQILPLGSTTIPVYFFIPVKEEDRATHPALFIFRGTRFSFSNATDARSIIENFHQVGPARGPYDEFRKPLGEFLHRWVEKHPAYCPTFRILGYSQGGVLGQRAVIDFHPYMHKQALNGSIFFNSPGVEADYYISWQAIPERMRPAAQNYLVTKDIVSKYQRNFIGETFEVEPLVESFLRAHLGSKILSPEWKLYLIDNEKEEESYTRKLINELMASSMIMGFYHLAAKGLEKLHTQPTPHNVKKMR